MITVPRRNHLETAPLSRRGERVFRRGWALKIDDPNAPLRLETEWPIGEHGLRIDQEIDVGLHRGGVGFAAGSRGRRHDGVSRPPRRKGHPR